MADTKTSESTKRVNRFKIVRFIFLSGMIPIPIQLMIFFISIIFFLSKGKKLGISDVCLATACMIYHRFANRLDQLDIPHDKFDPFVINSFF